MSDFKNKVFRIIKKIPRGKVLTYQRVANKIKKPRAVWAVAFVLSKNFDPSIPCHRVIRSDGKIGGYNRGAQKKIKLLKQEGIKIIQGKLAIFD